jgi:hypothetical protein
VNKPVTFTGPTNAIADDAAFSRDFAADQAAGPSR